MGRPDRAQAWLIAISAIVIIAACAPRGQLAFVDDAPGTPHDILLATSRAPVADTPDFGPERAADMSYAAYKVSVPPQHQIGQIEWPGARPDAERHFVTTGHRDFADAGAFGREVSARALALPRGHREAVIFIHGYNTNLAEGLYRFTQINHDFEARSIPILYSWPSAASPRDYLYDRDSILFARTGLERLIDQISRTPVERILLVGHSMGGQLVMEVLRQRAIRAGRLWPKLDMVALIAPDLDIEVFRSQASEIGPLPQPFLVFASARDWTLRLSEWLSGSTGKLGTINELAGLAALDVTVIDTTEVKGKGVDWHLSAATSPWMISLLKGLQKGDDGLTAEAPRAALPSVRVVVDDRASGLVMRPW